MVIVEGEKKRRGVQGVEVESGGWWREGKDSNCKDNEFKFLVEFKNLKLGSYSE